ncbi:hypothetical protein [Caballeronia sp. KNU42]
MNSISRTPQTITPDGDNAREAADETYWRTESDSDERMEPHETNSYARSEQTSRRTKPQMSPIVAARDLTKSLFEYITGKPKTSFLNTRRDTRPVIVALHHHPFSFFDL